MPRSHKIYILSHNAFGTVAAAFTVKHELMSYLKEKHENPNWFPLSEFTVQVVNDGRDDGYHVARADRYLGESEL